MVKIIGNLDLTRFLKPKKKAEKKPEKPHETIHFDWDRKHSRIIGRLANGKIAIISYDYKGASVHAGDDWYCAVQEMENKAVVIPEQLICSAKENQELIQAGLSGLLNKDWNEKKSKRKKS